MNKKPNSPESSFSPQKTSGFVIVQNVAMFFLSLAVLFVLAVIIIYPLWFFATQYKSAYTLGTLIALLFLFAAFFVLRLLRAIRHSSLDEFYLRLLHWFSVLFLLVTQLLFALLNIVLINFTLNNSQTELVPVIISFLGAAIGISALFLLNRSRHLKLLSSVGFIIFIILFSLHFLYWGAVLFVRNLPLPLVLLLASILGFFFVQKMTKINKEKKKPKNEEIQS